MKNEMQIIQKDQLLIIRFFGEIDNLVTKNYRERLVYLIKEKEFPYVIMNFEHVNFIDSSGIGMVLGRYNQIKGYNGILFVTKLSKITYKLFDLTGIFKIIDCIDNEEIPLVKVGRSNESNGS